VLLGEIENLAPQRQFYPANLRVMETVTWSDTLTASIQDDRYLELVNLIKQKSDLLAPFDLKEEAGSHEQIPVVPETAPANDPDIQSLGF
jgi:hypothetical protein